MSWEWTHEPVPDQNMEPENDDAEAEDPDAEDGTPDADDLMDRAYAYGDDD